MKKEKNSFQELIDLMAHLRSQSGCPWDRKQTHKSLLPYLIEEAYEVWDTIQENEEEKLKEELGDLLLQIVFHSQIAKENKKFDIYDVINILNEKLKKRHPHVFKSKKKISAQKVLKNWEHIKLENDQRKSVLETLPKNLPALLKASRAQEKVARFDFDWEKTEDIFVKIKEELKEFEKVYKKKNKKKIEAEIGDIFFSLVNLCRHLNINPEYALRLTINKFIQRFNYIEKKLAQKKIPLKNAGLKLMDELWEEAKKK